MTPTIDPTPEQIARLAGGPPEEGPIVMLNLLRFREQAELAPGAEAETLTGRESYQRYAQATAPHLSAVGGRLLNVAQCAETVIGEDREWDLVALVEYPSRSAFLAMVGNPDYQASTHLRTAALADSRLILCEPGMPSLV